MQRSSLDIDKHKQKLKALFREGDISHDPFSFLNALASYVALRDIGMDAIVSFIQDYTPAATSFLMHREHRNLTKPLPYSRNFRRELFSQIEPEKPTLWIEELILRSDETLLNAMLKSRLFASTHGVLLSSDEKDRIALLFRVMAALAKMPISNDTTYDQLCEMKTFPSKEDKTEDKTEDKATYNIVKDIKSLVGKGHVDYLKTIIRNLKALGETESNLFFEKVDDHQPKFSKLAEDIISQLEKEAQDKLKNLILFYHYQRRPTAANVINRKREPLTLLMDENNIKAKDTKDEKLKAFFALEAEKKLERFNNWLLEGRWGATRPEPAALSLLLQNNWLIREEFQAFFSKQENVEKWLSPINHIELRRRIVSAMLAGVGGPSGSLESNLLLRMASAVNERGVPVSQAYSEQISELLRKKEGIGQLIIMRAIQNASGEVKVGNYYIFSALNLLGADIANNFVTELEKIPDFLFESFMLAVASSMNNFQIKLFENEKITAKIIDILFRQDLSSALKEAICSLLLLGVKTNEQVYFPLIKAFIKKYEEDPGLCLSKVIELPQIMRPILHRYRYSPTVKQAIGENFSKLAALDVVFDTLAKTGEDEINSYIKTIEDPKTEEKIRDLFLDILCNYSQAVQQLHDMLHGNEEKKGLTLSENDIRNLKERIYPKKSENPEKSDKQLLADFLKDRMSKLEQCKPLQDFIKNKSVEDSQPAYDLLSYPTADLCQPLAENEELVIGDLHANALKLLYLLLIKKIIFIPKEDYESFVNIYLEEPEYLTKAHLDELDRILQDIRIINPYAIVNLLGDTLLDRGSNDFFVLKLRRRLKEGGIDLITEHSNHDKLFIQHYKKLSNQEEIKTSLENNQDNSFAALHKLIKKGLVKYDEVVQMIEEDYLPSLKLMHASVSRDDKGNVTVARYNHARTGIDTFWDMEEIFHTDFPLGSVKEIMSSIDRLNKLVAEHPELLLECDKSSISRLILRKQSGLDAVLWNRSYDDYLLQSEYMGRGSNTYRHVQLHGHDSEGPSKLSFVICLDNEFGKNIEHFKVPVKKAGFAVCPADEALMLRKRFAKFQDFVCYKARSVFLDGLPKELGFVHSILPSASLREEQVKLIQDILNPFSVLLNDKYEAAKGEEKLNPYAEFKMIFDAFANDPVHWQPSEVEEKGFEIASARIKEQQRKLARSASPEVKAVADTGFLSSGLRFLQGFFSPSGSAPRASQSKEPAPSGSAPNGPAPKR